MEFLRAYLLVHFTSNTSITPSQRSAFYSVLYEVKIPVRTVVYIPLWSPWNDNRGGSNGIPFNCRPAATDQVFKTLAEGSPMQTVNNWIDARVEGDQKDSQLVSGGVRLYVRAESEQKVDNAVWDPSCNVDDTHNQGHEGNFLPGRKKGEVKKEIRKCLKKDPIVNVHPTIHAIIYILVPLNSSIIVQNAVASLSRDELAVPSISNRGMIIWSALVGQ